MRGDDAGLGHARAGRGAITANGCEVWWRPDRLGLVRDAPATVREAGRDRRRRADGSATPRAASRRRSRSSFPIPAGAFPARPSGSNGLRRAMPRKAGLPSWPRRRARKARPRRSSVASGLRQNRRRSGGRGAHSADSRRRASPRRGLARRPCALHARKLRRDDGARFSGGDDRRTAPARAGANREPRRRVPAGRRRSRRRGRGFLDRRGAAGLFHPPRRDLRASDLRLLSGAISAPHAARPRRQA